MPLLGSYKISTSPALAPNAANKRAGGTSTQKKICNLVYMCARNSLQCVIKFWEHNRFVGSSHRRKNIYYIYVQKNHQNRNRVVIT